jgi:hypothetical protein
MDEHSIKKQRYLNTIFAISKGFPDILVPLVEIVKTNTLSTLDIFFDMISLLNVTGSELYDIYKTKCTENNDEFVKHILEIAQ